MTCNLQHLIEKQKPLLDVNDRGKKSELSKTIKRLSIEFNNTVKNMKLLDTPLIFSSEKCSIRSRKNCTVMRVKPYASYFLNKPTKSSFHDKFVEHVHAKTPFCFFILVNSFKEPSTFRSHMLIGFVYKKNCKRYLYILDPNGNISPKVNVYNIPDPDRSTYDTINLYNPWYKHIKLFFSKFTLEPLDKPSQFKQFDYIDFYKDNTLIMQNCHSTCFYRSFTFLLAMSFHLDIENTNIDIIKKSISLTKDILGDTNKSKFVVDLVVNNLFKSLKILKNNYSIT